MIAKAMAQDTPLICLDEPTSFLDFQSKVEMLRLLRRLSNDNGKTIFLSTHDVELALQMADSLWLMEQDNKLNIGTPRQLADNGSLSRFFDNDSISFDPATLRLVIVS